jgi:hypothetical protein
MRRTDVELLTARLRTYDKHQASQARLAGDLDWALDKVHRVVVRAETEGAPVFVGKAGVVMFRGSERGSDVGLYGDVLRVIETYWGPRDMGLRNIKGLRVAHSGTHGSGVWSHPDVVVVADPRRRAEAAEPPRVHAIEVETTSGFDLRSVYQAHAQAEGANYAWVFGCAVDDESVQWARIMKTAAELGVGVVTFARPHAYGTWTTHLEASHRQPDTADRSSFLARVLSAEERRQLNR